MKKFINALLAPILVLACQMAICYGTQDDVNSPIKLAENNSATFVARITPSVQDSKMEWWFNLPTNSAPNVIAIDKVLYFQNFSIFSFFENAAIVDGKFNVTYSISSTDPNGKRTVVAENISMKGEKLSQGVIVASTHAVQACFNKMSPKGKYTFEITAKDEISGATSKGETIVTLSEWNASGPLLGKKTVELAILNYHKNPSPELLYSIFYSPDLDLEQKGAPNDLNYIYLGFIRSAFLRNSFLSPYIRNTFPTMSTLDRAKTLYLFSIIDEARIDFNLLTETERKYQDAMRKADIPAPYADWNPVLGAVQIDMLLGEFLADGTYKPIRRIMNLLSFVEEGNFAFTMLTEKRKPANREEWKKMMMGVYHNAAIHTILNNAERFELVRKYCKWALENKDIPESTHKLFGDILEK